ncbi:MAG: MBL fold metallo-hydrolase [Chloroflexi bacterium]|nr:MBL fold metallo-hydrolase [Chloroflexota bacterium]
MSERFEIVFLGTGGPLPNADRCGAGHVVVAGDTNVLVDCGWGAARKLIPSGVTPSSIGTALFTHMHSDHITDVPDFLFLRWVTGATTPLRVYGPEGTQEMIDGFMMALRRDIGFRIAHHGDKLHPNGIKVEVEEIPATESRRQFLDIGALRFESFEVNHFPVVPALGFRATYDDRSVVLSGDTKMCDSLSAASRDVDMLVCEALNVPMLQGMIDSLRPNAPLQAGTLEDVPSYHISTPEIAELARDANVGEVVLTHVLPSVKNDSAAEEAFMKGMSDVYPGSIRMARDTQRIPVRKRDS